MMPFGLFFGWPAGGVWPNLVASAIWAAPAGAALVRKLHRQHADRQAQAERHHVELMAQAAAHHNALKLQAVKHQAELLDRAEAHHEALKAHVTSAMSTRKVTRGGT